MNYAPGGMFGGMYGQMPMTSAGGWNTANAGGSNLRLQDDMGGWFPPGMYSKGPGLRSNFGMPSQAAMNSDAMMRQNFMGSGMARFGQGGMFGGFQGGQQGGDMLSDMGGGRFGSSMNAPRGGGMDGGRYFWGGSEGFDESGTTGPSASEINAYKDQRMQQALANPQALRPFDYGSMRQTGKYDARAPQMSTGYTVNEPMPQQFPQMSQPFQATQMQAPVQQARPQQSFEDFASTLSGSGMTSGQMNDLYQKQIAKASAPAPTNFWQNVGPGGTQNPFPQSPQPFPQNWGQQRFNFDPRSLAGQQVTGDLGWFYGRDAIGRQINAQGDAVPTFRSPADGFQRTRPWFGGM